jgi:hypothetical protein
MSEIGRRYCHGGTEVKGPGIFADESVGFARRAFLTVRGTPMILWVAS